MTLPNTFAIHEHTKDVPTFCSNRLCNYCVACSLRAQFQIEDSPINPLHGSDTVESAEQEIKKFFPPQSTIAVIKPEVEPDQRGKICCHASLTAKCVC